MDSPISCLTTPTLVCLLLPSLFLGLWLLRLLWPFAKGNTRRPPVAGTIFHQLFHLQRIYDYQTDLSRRHKTFRLLTPTCSHVYTTDPANVEHILKSNFANYGKGPANTTNLGALLGEGIFAVDGEKWRHQRKLASYEFSTKVLRDFSSTVFRTNAAKLAQVISNLASSGMQFDVQDLLTKSTLDSIFRVGFGVELNSLSGSSEEFARAFDESTALSLRRYVDPFWKLKRFLNIGPEAALRRNVEVIDDFIYKVIREKTEQTSPIMDKEDILSRFVGERRNNPEKMTERYLRDITLNFIVAGRDTTAVTLSWFFYMMCKYPSVQERIQQEVKEATHTGGSMSIDEFKSRLTESALREMQHLHAALTETLRLYPAVPMDAKYCFGDDTLPDGYAVREGDTVDYQPYPMGRMERLWGHDVEVFRPERWLDEAGVFQPESPFKFTAFQSGPRICLGKEFAYRQMKIFAATLLFFFRFELNVENQIVNYRVSLTMQIDDGLHLRAYRR